MCGPESPYYPLLTGTVVTAGTAYELGFGAVSQDGCPSTPVALECRWSNGRHQWREPTEEESPGRGCSGNREH